MSFIDEYIAYQKKYEKIYEYLFFECDFFETQKKKVNCNLVNKYSTYQKK